VLIVLPTAHKASTSQYIFTDALGRERNRQILWIAGESMITRRPW
jgi:hypothetical protein